MYQFKEGDRVEAIKDISSFFVKGDQCTIKEISEDVDPLLKFEDISGWWSIVNWQLVEPKERTIEDVVVGDIIINSDHSRTVEEVTENLFASSDELGRLEWAVKRIIAEGGSWKIKQPEPEKKENKQYIATSTNSIVELPHLEWIQTGLKEGWLKEGRIDYKNYDLSNLEQTSCPDGKPCCLVMHYKPKNK